MPRAARRSPASAATSGEVHATCCDIARDLGADASATGHYVAPGRRAGTGRSCTAPPTRPRTRAISCSPPPPTQLDFLRFPAGRPAQGRGPRPCAGGWAWRSPTSPTARTSASSPTATIATWWRGCGPTRSSPARSSTSTAACSAGTTGIAHFTVGQRRGLDVADGEPLYVVGIEPDAAPRRGRPAHEPAVRRDRARRGQLAGAPPDAGAGCRSRSSIATTSPPCPARSRPSAEGRASVELARAAARRRARPGLRLLRGHAACWAAAGSSAHRCCGRLGAPG